MNKIEEILDRYQKEKDIRAMSLCIRKEHQPWFAYHCGKMAKKGKPIHENTLFTIGSVSKIFTTVAILLLKDRNQLSLDQPVFELMPKFTMQDERYKKITVRMLLNHSAGFYGNASRGKYTLNANRDYLEQVLDYMGTCHLKAEPGKFSVYCNDGFALAEALIETVTQESYAEFVLENILAPLKMMNTDFPDHEIREGRIVYAKSLFDEDYPQEFVNGIGSGGIYSTAQDLCTFMEAINDKKLLSEESWLEMNRCQIPDTLLIEKQTSCNYGLGWDTVELDTMRCFGLKAMGKSGSTYGFGSYVLACPEAGISAAIVMSSTDGNPSLLLKKILATLMIEEGMALNIPSCFKPQEIKQIERIVGFYGNNSTLFEIQAKSNGLILKELSSDKQYEFNEAKIGYHCNEKFMDRKHSLIWFMEERDNLYLVHEYDNEAVMGLRQRIPLLQKLPVSSSEVNFQAAGKSFIMDNEYPTQRCLGYLPMILDIKKRDGLIITPYPLMIQSETEAVPFIEIPGEYSREMVPLHCLKDGSITLGQYHYLPLEQVKAIHTTEFVLEEGKTVWFKGTSQIDTFKMDGWGRCVMLDGSGLVIFDSALSYAMPEKLEGLFIGFMGQKGTTIAIEA